MKSEVDNYVPALGYAWLTRFYDPVIRLTTRENSFKSALVRQVNAQPDESILDLGCGTGTLAIALKKSQPKAWIYGLDGDVAILKIAEAKAQQTQTAIHFEPGLSFALPYADETFDSVTSSLFFHHLTTKDKLRTFVEVRRVLKPGGRFCLADWSTPQNWLMRIIPIKKLRTSLRAKGIHVYLTGCGEVRFKTNHYRCEMRTEEFLTLLRKVARR